MLVRYSEAKETLFRILRDKERVSLSYFRRKAMLSNNIAVKTLANMIIFDLIEMDLGENQSSFFLKSDRST